MRLIDMGDLMETINKRVRNSSIRAWLYNIVSDTPTIEAVPANPAHWIINGDWGECSHCHEASKLSVMEHKDYCPACGAHMIEEVETNG